MKTYILLLTGLLIFNTESSFAQPGTLDSSFGKNGKVTTQIDKKTTGGAAALIQADGKIVVAGYWELDYYFSSLALIRYEPDGKVDSSFGVNGVVHLSREDTCDVFAIAMDNKQRILVAGSIYVKGNLCMLLVRYKPNGSRDKHFGTKGRVITAFAGFENALATAINIQHGKILLAGVVNNHVNNVAALVRYKTNGTPDSSFGTDGKVVTDTAMHINVSGVTIQKDEKIVVGGSAGPPFGARDFAVLRFKPDGRPDKTFGINGSAIFDFGADDEAGAIALQQDQKIVLGGESNGDFLLARYQPDGTLDSSFGNNGKVLTDFFNSLDYIRSLAIQSNGKIIAAGESAHENIPGYDFSVARYKPAGSLDKSFGLNGKVTTDFYDPDDYGNSVVIQQDGKIVVAGISGRKFALARYIGDPVTHNVFSRYDFSKKAFRETAVQLSPNPVKDMLHIENLSPSSKTISLLDISGRVLQKSITANSTYTISTKQLPAGIYFIKIDEGDKTTSLKFVRQ